jgi:cell volume regulation protein A
MEFVEPRATAFFVATCGTLLFLSSLSGRIGARFGIPLTALFLAVGMLAGSDGIGGIAFNNYALTYRLGTAALILILFDGGLNTSVAAVRRVAAAASVLSTVVVLGTAALVALGAYLLRIPLGEALLLGAVVSSTDAASVFAVLRGSGIHLRHRVALTLEAESGLNDPMAVILTTLVTANIAAPMALLGWGTLWEVVREASIGAVVGVGIGAGSRYILQRLRLTAGGLYPVFTLAVALLAYGLPTLAHGSGFLAVYLAGMTLGNRDLPHRGSLLRVHDALAWLGQVSMFVLLGLLLFPSRLGDVAVPGLAIGLFSAIIARPAIVMLSLIPMGYTVRESFFIGWMGLRGAVPIILATFPVLARAPGAERICDLVFFVVAVSTVLHGFTGGPLARYLQLETAEPPSPPAVLEIESVRPLSARITPFYVDEALAVAGESLQDLPLPEGASVALIVRGDDLVTPHGSKQLQVGDHVYVLMKDEDAPLVGLMFGRAEGDD